MVVSDLDEDDEADGEEVVDNDEGDGNEDDEGILDGEGIFVIFFFGGGVFTSSGRIAAPFLNFPSESDTSGISDISSCKASVLLGCIFNAALRSR